eukprot:11176255-Lingulodinium_polyedra.AAC.1
MLDSFVPLASFMPDSCYSRRSCQIDVIHAYIAAAAARNVDSPLESTLRRYNGSQTARSRAPCADRKS